MRKLVIGLFLVVLASPVFAGGWVYVRSWTESDYQGSWITARTETNPENRLPKIYYWTISATYKGRYSAPKDLQFDQWIVGRIPSQKNFYDTWNVSSPGVYPGETVSYLFRWWVTTKYCTGEYRLSDGTYVMTKTGFSDSAARHSLQDRWVIY